MLGSLTGGQILIRSLQAARVQVVFGLPGVHNLAAFDALAETPDIRLITTRHEQGAGFMAAGYASASGRVGVCLTTSGPGATNALTPMAQAFSNSTPVLFIASQVASHCVDRRCEGLHDLNDSLDVFAAATQWSARARSVEEIPGLVQLAMARLLSGRSRPVYLEIPHDILERSGRVAIEPMSGLSPLPGDPALIRRAAHMLARAQRPLILVGGGVIAAGVERVLLQLAELLHAPVVTSIRGKGAIPEDHPLCLGDGWAVQGLTVEAMNEADIVLALGTHFDDFITRDWELPVPGALIHVDVDLEELGKHYQPSLGIVGDVRLVLPQMLTELSTLAMARHEVWMDVPAVRQRRLHYVRQRIGWAAPVLEGLRELLDRDALVFNDLAAINHWATALFPVYSPRTFHYPTGFATLGYGLPAALGAKVAFPARPVVLLAGDGGFLFTLQELATAVQENLGVVSIIFNDNAYGSIKVDQRVRYGRTAGVELRNPDFVALARAFGMRGTRTERPEALSEAVAEALRDGEPALIEVPCPTVAPPWVTGDGRRQEEEESERADAA